MNIALLVLVPLVGYLAAKWAFKKKTEIEKRRAAAMAVTNFLRDYGLVRIPSMTGKYAIGDYSGLIEEFMSFAALIIGDPSVLTKEFDTVFSRVLDKKLATTDGRTLLAAKLADMVKPGDPSVVSSVTAAVT